MDIKDLNKSQLIMLAILLSFVTSIATGITTVTLMEQAPDSVTAPINRVVRQTVEKIVPGSTKTETVIIKEEDLVVDAIAKNKSALFSVTKEVFDPEKGDIVEVSAGKGFVVSADGIIASDGGLVYGNETYFVKNDSGKFKASFISKQDGFSLLKIGNPTDETSKINFTLPVFGDIEKIKIGQKIIVFGDSISSSIFDGNSDINLSVTKSTAGGIVMNLDGEVIGMALSGEASSFVPMSLITKSLQPKTN